MKPGEPLINKATGQSGTFTHVCGGKLYGIDATGKRFAGTSAKGRKPKQLMVRVRDGSEYLTGPVEAEYRDGGYWVNHPVFVGQKLSKCDVEVVQC